MVFSVTPGKWRHLGREQSFEAPWRAWFATAKSRHRGLDASLIAFLGRLSEPWDNSSLEDRYCVHIAMRLDFPTLPQKKH